MSDLRVNNIVAEGGASAPNFAYGFQVPTGYGVTGAGGINITGVVTCGSIAGNVTGNVTGNASGTAGGLSGNPNISIVNLTASGDATVGGALTITGNMTVDGTQTVVNTSTLDVADKTVGIASTTTASNTTAAGAGIEIYASATVANNNKTILWQNTSNCFEFSENVKLKGVNETSINNGSTGVQPYIN